MENKKLLILIIIGISLFTLPQIVKAESIIYDNITSANFKTIKIQSDNLNIGYVNEYQYEVYINNSFLGYFKKGDNIFVPDNTSITIFIPSPTKTDVSDVFSTYIKPTLVTTLGFIFSWGLGIIILLGIIYLIYRDYIKRR